MARAAAILREAANPIVLAGHGAARADAGAALLRFAERLGVPVATTFHGKGVFPDDHPQALGAVGFMRHDYVNFGFDQADAIVAVGYELQEFDPVRINPRGDKQIIHIHRFPAEVDLHYNVAVGLQADISRSLDALAAALDGHFEDQTAKLGSARLLAQELAQGRQGRAVSPGSGPHRRRYPGGHGSRRHRPRRHRRAENVDGPALSHLRAEHVPDVERPVHHGMDAPRRHRRQDRPAGRKVLVATGDGGFLMNSQEIETALRERIPMVILIWVDNAYGLISWKMDLEIGHDVDTRSATPTSSPTRRASERSATRSPPPTSCCRPAGRVEGTGT